MKKLLIEQSGITFDNNKTIKPKNLTLRLLKNKSGSCFLQAFDKQIGLWIDILEISPYGQVKRCDDEIPDYFGLDKCVNGKVLISN